MFSRILIANRGEIALRIIRACRDLGVSSVAVYSEADKNAMYLRYADYTVCIGPAPSSQSYLNIARIISAAEITDVDAIHPGCGFLAENPHFAEVCETSNIKFIGPKAEVIKRLGDKSEAKRIAKENKIPIVPGSDGAVEDDQEALKMAAKIGYPVIVKALGGGGGRGMRVAHNDISLQNAMFVARHEAEVSFGNPAIYLEKCISGARHIEVQILGDEHGNILHLGLRDCSLQRRYQKLIEESPPPGLPERVAEDIARAAIRLAKAVNYTNAGTIEFLVDRKGHFYFMEANTRLQVEHPVTEMVTGLDLVKEQLRIASGSKLRLRQSDIHLKGSAIECRINAEDPDNGFKPCPGRIQFYNPPGGPGVRLDTHIYNGYEVSPHYDALIGKLIAYQDSRQDSMACMRRALDEFVIEGVKTTIPLFRTVFGHQEFIKGGVDTNWLERFFGTSA
jgi:acetyl-CoA carboxylase biotin carboxylase subunit